MTEKNYLYEGFLEKAISPDIDPFSQNPYRQLVCPICAMENQHIDSTEVEPGHDNYAAGWSGRGDLAKVTFWSECGSKWQMCFGFHKGVTFTFVRILESCTIDYYKYIQSPEWKERADQAKQHAGYRCQVCNKSAQEVTLNAHHRTYERLGHELPGDLTVLCQDCHYLYHENKRMK